MYHYVYKLVHIDTGEFYYGSRSCKCKPSDDVKYKGSMVAWKPNKDKLTKYMIKDGFISRDSAIEYETKLIQDSIDDVLNRNYHIPGKGFHTVGLSRKISDEQRKLISKNSKKYWDQFSLEERRELLKNCNHNKPHTIEARQKMSNMLRGKNHSEKTKKKMSESHKGIIKDDVWRQNLSESLSGKPKSEEHIAKLRDCHKIPVVQMDLDGNVIREWDSQLDAKKELGITHITDVCKGRSKTAGGFRWKYKY